MSSGKRSLSSSADVEFADAAFSKRSPGDLLLVTEGSAGFYFPRSILIDQSSFFRGLCTIPTDENSADYPRIELEGVESGGVGTGLGILQFVFRGTGELPPIDRHILSLLTFADLCDLPIIPRLLYHLYGSDGTFDPWLKFLLAVLTGKDDRIAEVYRDVSTRHLSTIRSPVRQALQKWTPDVWSKLNSLQVSYLEATLAMSHDITDYMEHGDNIEECSSDHCETETDFDGDWGRFAEAMGSRMWLGTQFLRLADAERVGKQLLVDDIDCESCRDRMRHAWNRYIRARRTHAPTW